jgi:hypothetical protein
MPMTAAPKVASLTRWTPLRSVDTLARAAGAVCANGYDDVETLENCNSGSGMTKRTIDSFIFYPFADGRAAIGLRFPFDQQLIDELKSLERMLRPQVRPDSAVGWLAPHKAWFVDVRCWPQVALALISAGHTLVGEPADELRTGRGEASSLSADPVRLRPPQPVVEAKARSRFLGTPVRACTHCGAATLSLQHSHCGLCLAIEQALLVANAAWNDRDRR